MVARFVQLVRSLSQTTRSKLQSQAVLRFLDNYLCDLSMLTKLSQKIMSVDIYLMTEIMINSRIFYPCSKCNVWTTQTFKTITTEQSIHAQAVRFHGNDCHR